MSMNLTPDQLVEIAGKLKQISSLGPDVDIRQARVAGHTIFLRMSKNMSQGGDPLYYVTGITDRDVPNHHTSMRGGDN